MGKQLAARKQPMDDFDKLLAVKRAADARLDLAMDAFRSAQTEYYDAPRAHNELENLVRAYWEAHIARCKCDEVV